ncbi:hypothetical protein ACQRBN_04145 [Bariatricus sp. SGI.154]|uniref:hypothetical protein n=1 Tax=Bariatricus sp. SGI.154 TaxID=3420549 RepID=UPI003D00473B
MKGSHRVIIEAKRVKYDFTLTRNITILTGDSASGKTVLIDYIRDYRRYGSESGVMVSCDRECRTLDNEDWEMQLKRITNSIIFIDEGNRFVTSKEFAKLALESDNYFVLATREKMPMLPYSVQEIYGFRESGKYHEAKQKYNEMYHLYGEISAQSSIEPELVITEDSNSGYDFFAKLSEQKNVNCISANGKSNIIKCLQDSEKTQGTRLIIVDGAAFGSEMKEVYEYLNTVGNVVLYAPKSFEWLLLSSNTIPNANVTEILQEPENYIDSKKYASWERFFTALLIDMTKGDPVWSYSKKKISSVYVSSKVITAVKKMMKLVIWD